MNPSPERLPASSDQTSQPLDLTISSARKAEITAAAQKIFAEIKKEERQSTTPEIKAEQTEEELNLQSREALTEIRDDQAHPRETALKVSRELQLPQQFGTYLEKNEQLSAGLKEYQKNPTKQSRQNLFIIVRDLSSEFLKSEGIVTTLAKKSPLIRSGLKVALSTLLAKQGREFLEKRLADSVNPADTYILTAASVGINRPELDASRQSCLSRTLPATVVISEAEQKQLDEQKAVIIAQHDEIMLYDATMAFYENNELQAWMQSRKITLTETQKQAITDLNPADPTAIQRFINENKNSGIKTPVELLELQHRLKTLQITNQAAANTDLRYAKVDALSIIAADNSFTPEEQEELQARIFDQMNYSTYQSDYESANQSAAAFIQYIESSIPDEDLSIQEKILIYTIYQETIQPTVETITNLESNLEQNSATLTNLQIENGKIIGELKTQAGQSRSFQLAGNELEISDPYADDSKGDVRKIDPNDPTSLAETLFAIDVDAKFTEIAKNQSQKTPEFQKISDQELLKLTTSLHLHDLSPLERQNVLTNYLTILLSTANDRATLPHSYVPVDKKILTLSQILTNPAKGITLQNILNQPPSEFKKKFPGFDDLISQLTT